MSFPKFPLIQFLRKETFQNSCCELLLWTDFFFFHVSSQHRLSARSPWLLPTETNAIHRARNVSRCYGACLACTGHSMCSPVLHNPVGLFLPVIPALARIRSTSSSSTTKGLLDQPWIHETPLKKSTKISYTLIKLKKKTLFR